MEDTESQTWEPDGDRWLKRISCDSCSGEGHISSVVESKCPRCEGNGFVDSPDEGAILCPECHGKRIISAVIEEMCQSCSGRGYHPKVMQNFVCSVKCTKCGGVGTIESDDDEYEECYSCNGSGRSETKEYCPLPKWKTSHLNTGETEQVIWAANELNNGYRNSCGCFVEVVLCKECSKLSNDDVSEVSEVYDVLDEETDPLEDTCPVCEGLRRVIEVTEACDDCNGFGSNRISEECPDCEGEGVVYLNEDREV